MDTLSCKEIDVDSYKREVSTKLAEAWELAKSASRRAQNSQKIYYDHQTTQFNVGDRVFVHMPA